jgi:hypothetical protein
MKLLNDVKEILDKTDLTVKIPEKYPNVYEYSKDQSSSYSDKKWGEDADFDLSVKYKEYIPNGWYGFGLGYPTPSNWVKVLDEILELLTKTDPEFEIHQIKIKYGGIRFYVESEKIEDLDEIEELIENRMQSKLLMY